VAADVNRDPGVREWGSRSRRIRLLDFDPDLGAELDGDAFEEARRHVLLPALTIATGGWEVEALGSAEGVHGRVYGFVIVKGAVTIDVNLGGRACTRLIMPNELVLLDGWESSTLPLTWGWTAIEPTTVGVLDRRLLAIARRWPVLMGAILIRGAEQLRHATLQQAISQIPRVEHRLLALMWSVADHRGVVREDGVWVRLPVTHDALARMIGARRPTVSLGLKGLSERGLLVSEGGGWLLSRASLNEFVSPGAA
jgi:CRP/FNR family transcriptional regulator, cyclic AMP receptor protein